MEMTERPTDHQAIWDEQTLGAAETPGDKEMAVGLCRLARLDAQISLGERAVQFHPEIRLWWNCRLERWTVMGRCLPATRNSSYALRSAHDLQG